MPPPTPTRAELLNWGTNYQKLWNAGDREAWIANYRTVLATDKVYMLDPVGTPAKEGFQHCMVDSFHLFQPNVKYDIQKDTVFVCGTSIAWLMHNLVTSNGKTQIIKSIETFTFEPDGSMTVRTWYDVPQNAEGELGEMFTVYLPEHSKGQTT